MAHEIHISVVSHGHGSHIEQLLADLAALPDPASLQLTLTHNVPETLQFDLQSLPFPVQLQRNSASVSFSRNHNAAFRLAPRPDAARYFVVLNPDVRVSGRLFHDLAALLEQHSSEAIGLLGPSVIDEQGTQQANGRIFPDFAYLWRKLLGSEPENPVHVENGIAKVDWVAGMCMVMHCDTFAELYGFDEQYRLYYEDVDLCLRLRQRGLLSAIAADISLQHQGQWQSRRNLLHLWWHCRSVLRFLAKRRSMPDAPSAATSAKPG